MKLHTLGSKVLVKALPKEESKDIVSSEEENIIKGEVISLGKIGFTLTATEMKFNADDLKVKDLVWFNKFDTIHLPFDDSLYVLERDDIVVVESNG